MCEKYKVPTIIPNVQVNTESIAAPSHGLLLRKFKIIKRLTTNPDPKVTKLRNSERITNDPI